MLQHGSSAGAGARQLRRQLGPSRKDEAIDSHIARMLDANLNRGREALRVLEEYARYVLGDAFVCRGAKALRHDLSALASDRRLAAAIRSRNILDDVGTAIDMPTEYRRRDVQALAVAAGKRLAEAMRVLEECAKTVDDDLAHAVEQMRYAGYELERQLLVRIDARDRFGCVRLYVLICEAWCANDWLATAEAAIAGGADALQLREKALSDAELLARTRRLASLCHERGVLLLVNDRPDIARVGGADGVHVGQADLSVADARQVVGPSALVGKSTHTWDQACGALAESPDYVAVGPQYATESKPEYDVAGPKLLSRVLDETSLPVVAIGGINAERAAVVGGTGARCVCVGRAIVGRTDVRGAAQSVKKRFLAALATDVP